jgi:hypothetical protein
VQVFRGRRDRAFAFRRATAGLPARQAAPVGLERTDLEVRDAWLLVAALEKGTEVMQIRRVLRNGRVAATLVAQIL